MSLYSCYKCEKEIKVGDPALEVDTNGGDNYTFCLRCVKNAYSVLCSGKMKNPGEAEFCLGARKFLTKHKGFD